MKLIADILKAIDNRLKPYEIVLMATIGIATIGIGLATIFWLDSGEKSNANTQVSQNNNKGQIIVVINLVGDIILNKFDEKTPHAIHNETQKGSLFTKNESNPTEKGSIIVGDLLTTTNKRRQLIVQAFKAGNIDKAGELLKKLDEEQDALDESLTQERVTTKLERAVLLTWSNPNESYRLLKEATELDSENLQALNQLGHISHRLGKMNEVASAYQQGLEIARRNHDRAWQGAFLSNLGLVFKQFGDLSAAKEHWQQALAIFDDIGSPEAKQVRGWLEVLDKQ